MIQDRSALEKRAEAVWLDILASLASDVPAITISAPPGAGKTRMVEDLALAALFGMGSSVCIAATTVAQVAEIARRIAAGTAADVTIYGGSGYRLAPELAALGVVATTDGKAATQALADGRVVVATVAKLAAVSALDAKADLLIMDEAWQVADYSAARVAGVGQRLVLIGDSGQIAPVVRVDTSSWADAHDGPHVAFPVALRARFGDEVVAHHLVASRRVPEDTAAMIGEIFYPECPFGSLAPISSLEWEVGGKEGVGKEVFSRLEAGASLVLAQCDAGTSRVAAEQAVLGGVVALVQEILARRPVRVESVGGVISRRALSEADIGVTCSRIYQVAAVRSALERAGLDIRVETAERWQGLEREIMVAFHPASSAGESGRFGLDAGRMCVMSSRHRLACVIVADEDVETELAAGGGGGRILSAGVDETRRGWVANLDLIGAIRSSGGVVRL